MIICNSRFAAPFFSNNSVTTLATDWLLVNYVVNTLEENNTTVYLFFNSHPHVNYSDHCEIDKGQLPRHLVLQSLKHLGRSTTSSKLLIVRYVPSKGGTRRAREVAATIRLSLPNIAMRNKKHTLLPSYHTLNKLLPSLGSRSHHSPIKSKSSHKPQRTHSTLLAYEPFITELSTRVRIGHFLHQKGL